MTVVPIPVLGSANPFESFYAPAFTLTILQQSSSPAVVVRHKEVDHDVVFDVESITYVDNVDEADAFTLTINNWDATGGRHKYVGLPEKPKDEPQLTWATLFEPGARFELKLGYRTEGAQRMMMCGYVTSMDVTFPQTGAVTLTVQAQDLARKVADATFSYRWENKRDSEIAKLLGRKPAGGVPGIGVPITTLDAAACTEAVHPTVVMRRQTVMDFLIERAKPLAYSVFRTVEGGKEAVFFGPSELLPPVGYTFEWGKSLLEFRPTLTVARQAKRVTVRGWHHGDRKPLPHTATLADIGLNADLHPYLEELGEHKEIVDQTLRTPAEVRDLARGTLRTSLKSLLVATGATIGLPDLRAGQVITIKGVDYRFDGRYFVLQTTHVLDSSGYRTTFKARREEPKR